MASVCTGTEMIVWGGEVPGRQFGDGAAYDPVTDSWRLLATSPLSARNAPAAVWTGEEVLLWGGHAGPSNGARDGAAYDPVTDSWRSIAQAPIVSAGAPQAAWTGKEMLVLAGVNSFAAAAYDPESDSWRTLAAVPAQPSPPYVRVVWTGDELVVRANYWDVLGSGLENGLFAYDPAADRWSELPPSSTDTGDLPNLHYAEGFLVQVTTEPGALVTRYDLDSGVWTGIARWPDELSQMVMSSAWTGDHMLLWGGDDVILVDPATGAITTTRVGGGTNRNKAAAVWADGVLLIWGGWEDKDDGIVLRPVIPEEAAPGTTVAIPADTAPAPQGEPTTVAGPEGLVGYLDPSPGPVEVNGRLLPVQRAYSTRTAISSAISRARTLTRDVVEDPNFDPATACTTVTTSHAPG